VRRRADDHELLGRLEPAERLYEQVTAFGNEPSEEQDVVVAGEADGAERPVGSAAGSTTPFGMYVTVSCTCPRSTL
jgi:hypothetical protein